MSLAAGTRLGPYEILAAIGAGGMGEVYNVRPFVIAESGAIVVHESDGWLRLNGLSGNLIVRMGGAGDNHVAAQSGWRRTRRDSGKHPVRRLSSKS